MLDPRFYLGPLGAMRPLPEVTSAVTAPLAVIGGTHTSLAGGFVRDVLGHKQSWSFTFPALSIEQANYVEAMRVAMFPGPLYLIDPRRPNRLPRDVAAGGSLTGSPAAFAATSNNTVAAWRPLSEIPGPDHYATLPASGLVTGAIEWSWLDPGAGDLALWTRGGDNRLRVPCLPGEPLACSAWFTGPATVAVALSVTVHDRRTAVLDTIVADPVPLDPTTWTPVTVELATGPDAAYLRLSATGDQPNGAEPVHTTAWSCHRADDPELVTALTQHCDWPDPTDGWRLGGGAAQVVPVDAADPAYPWPGLTSSALVLTER